MRLFTRLYGANAGHLVLLCASLAAIGYCAVLASASARFATMLLWFAAAVLAHDAVLLPLYSLADRALRTGIRHRPTLVNHVRIPLLGSGLLFLLFFPGIIGQGAATHYAATGMDQGPFLVRWLTLSGVLALISVVVHVVRVVLARVRATRTRDT